MSSKALLAPKEALKAPKEPLRSTERTFILRPLFVVFKDAVIVPTAIMNKAKMSHPDDGWLEEISDGIPEQNDLFRCLTHVCVCAKKMHFTNDKTSFSFTGELHFETLCVGI